MEWITCLHAVLIDKIQMLVQTERRDNETLCDTVQRLIEEGTRLRTLIVDYAQTTMPFEQFLNLALGEQRANEIMQPQRALQDQWHERQPGDNHAAHE